MESIKTLVKNFDEAQAAIRNADPCIECTFLCAGWCPQKKDWYKAFQRTHFGVPYELS